MDKSLLIFNKSNEARVTLYIYHKHDLLCWLSIESKIILPNETYLYRSENGSKFKLVAGFGDDRPKKILLECQKLDDKAITVNESLDCIEGNLADFPQEMRLCLRKSQRDKELISTCGSRNLYDILGLDMNEVRKMKREEQRKAIEKGFRKQLKIWHPDKNFGDDEVAKEIIAAREILLNDEQRSRYHNEADYSGGWLSLKRYQSIFWPECATEEQKQAYRRRMGMFAVSLLIPIGGIILTAVTAGMAAPLVVGIGGAIGGGLIGAGFQSLQHTVTKNAIVNGCDVKSWLLKGAIGGLGGLVTGGAAVGITAGIVGIGNMALTSAAVTTGQYIGIGAATGAVGGVASSLASDAGRKLVDGEDVTLKQVLGHAACGALIGGAAGVASGAVTKAFVARNTSAASANFRGDVGEQVAMLTGARRLRNALSHNLSRMLAESGTEAIMGTTAEFAEERLDSSVENQNPTKHLVNGVMGVAGKAVVGALRETSGTLISHGANECKVAKRLKKEKLDLETENQEDLMGEKQHNTPSGDIDETIVDGKNLKITLEQVREKENNEELVKWNSAKSSATYDGPTKTGKPLETINKEDNVTCDDRESDERSDGNIKYISEGYWFSKMIVNYILNGKECKHEVTGSGKSITIPSDAMQIEVSFQVRRPHWGNIMKYDRFQKSWCQPAEPHIFRYRTPPNRTFTICGNLWFEAVMVVSDEYHEETKEM